MKAENTDVVITVDNGYQGQLKLTFNKHGTLEDWIQAFKTILIHATFAEDTVKELFDTNEDNWFVDYLDKQEDEDNYDCCCADRRVTAVAAEENNPLVDDEFIHPCTCGSCCNS